MNGIYGSMLGYFPELIFSFPLYPVYKNADGLIIADRNAEPITVRGIMMDGLAYNPMGQSNSVRYKNKHNTIAPQGNKQFWCLSDLDSYLPIDAEDGEPCGYAMLDTPKKGEQLAYMILSRIAWSVEGNFFRYEIRLLGGNTSANTESPTADDYGTFLS